ncbi:MAG: hypothetical protein HY040_00055 [Planctomycetes bacterium]|nr:hypothetical protein [Planctomycetota bacterium]
MPTRNVAAVYMFVALAEVFFSPANEAVAGPFGRRCGCRRFLRPPACRDWTKATALRPWFEKDAAFYTLDHSTTAQVIHVMGQEITQKQDQTFAIRWNARGLDCEGNLIVNAKILAIKMRLEIGGNVIAYDSEKRPDPNPIGAFCDSLMQHEFRFVVMCDGNGVNIQGTSQLLKQLESSMPQYKWLAKSSVAHLVTLATPFLDFTPSSPVVPGDSWKKTRTHDPGPIGIYRDELVLTYLGRCGSLQRIEATGTLNYEAPSKAGYLPFLIRSADLNGPQSQVIVFDASRRRLAERIMNTQLSGNIVIEVGGLPTEVKLEQTQRRRVSLSDTNPTWQPPER